jgi:hypothetical protein
MEPLEQKNLKPRTSRDTFIKRNLSFKLSQKLKIELKKLYAKLGSRFIGLWLEKNKEQTNIYLAGIASTVSTQMITNCHVTVRSYGVKSRIVTSQMRGGC